MPFGPTNPTSKKVLSYTPFVWEDQCVANCFKFSHVVNYFKFFHGANKTQDSCSMLSLTNCTVIHLATDARQSAISYPI